MCCCFWGKIRCSHRDLTFWKGISDVLSVFKESALIFELGLNQELDYSILDECMLLCEKYMKDNRNKYKFGTQRS